MKKRNYIKRAVPLLIMAFLLVSGFIFQNSSGIRAFEQTDDLESTVEMTETTEVEEEIVLPEDIEESNSDSGVLDARVVAEKHQSIQPLAIIQNITIGNLKYTLDDVTLNATVAKQEATLTGDIIIPPTIEYDGKIFTVTTIDGGTTAIAGAFSNNTQITSITLPDTLKEIKGYAFNGCSGLRGNLTIPDSVTTIGTYAFKGCTRLTGDLVIPKNLASIGTYAFNDCKGFETLTILSNIASSQDNRFSGMTGVKKVTLGIRDITSSKINGLPTAPVYTLIDGVATIALNSFTNCSWIVELEILGADTVVTSAETSTFKGMTKLNKLTVGMRNITNSIFNGVTTMKTLILLDTVEVIGMGAFFRCPALEGKLVIPASVKTIGDQAFGGDANNIEELEILGPDTKFLGTGGRTLEGLLSVKKLTLGMKTVTNHEINKIKASVKELVLLNSVETIADSTFSNYGKLESVFFEDGEKPLTIGNLSFASCGNLKEVTLPDRLKNFDIATSVFNSCGKLKTINYPELATVPGELLEIFSKDDYQLPDVEEVIEMGDEDSIFNMSVDWSNTDLTEALVTIDYFQQHEFSEMDYIFVLDYGRDMNVTLTNEETGYHYSRFSFQESIVKQAAEILLDGNEKGFKNRVAATAFSSKMEFSTEFVNNMDDFIGGFYSFSSNNIGRGDHDYSKGLEHVRSLIAGKTEKERGTVVIFLNCATPPPTSVNTINALKGHKEAINNVGGIIYPMAMFNGKNEALKTLSVDGVTCYEARTINAITSIMSELILGSYSMEITKMESTISDAFLFHTGTIVDFETVPSNIGSITINEDTFTWDLTGRQIGVLYTIKAKIKLKDTNHELYGRIPATKKIVLEDESGKVESDTELHLSRYLASYEFINGMGLKPLPAGLLNDYPLSNGVYRNGTTLNITTPTVGTTYVDGNDTWEFIGWNTETQTIAGENVRFIGKWVVNGSTMVTVSKMVEGEYASRNKAFSFVVTFQGDSETPLPIGTEFTFVLIDNNTGSSEEGILAINDETGNTNFTLKDGQTIFIEDIPRGIEVRIVEQDANSYVTEISGSIEKTSKDTGFYTLGDEGAIFNYLNIMDIPPPSGIVDKESSWISIAVTTVLASAMLAIIKYRKKYNT